MNFSLCGVGDLPRARRGDVVEKTALFSRFLFIFEVFKNFSCEKYHEYENEKIGKDF